MPLLALALVLAAPASPELEAVQAAASTALAVPGATVQVLDLQVTPPSGCTLKRAEVPRPIAGSGREAVRLVGRGGGCETWGWARVRVTAPVLVTTRAVSRGSALEGAVAPRVMEITAGRPAVSTLPEGAVAARELPSGTPIEPTVIRTGPPPGEPVSVVVRAGMLTVEQKARALPCRRDRACALLPSGQRVEGTWHGGRIVLDQP